MMLFAAGNEIVTIILALIPVAVFLLSNLFKASQKPAKPVPPPPGARPTNQGLPGTVDLDSFLKEAKKRKAQMQSQAPSKPPQPPKPLALPQGNRSTPKPPPAPTPTPVANRGAPRPVPTAGRPPKQETTRERQARRDNSPENQRKFARDELVPQVPPTPVTAAVAEVPSPEIQGANRGKGRGQSSFSAGQSPISLALQLVRSGKAAPTSFVLQEIFARPRSQRPYQTPGGSAFTI